MKLIWIVAITIVLASGVVSAQSEDPANAPREMVQRFWKMETEGSRLTPEG
jgi:hypothetical protein